MNLTTALFDAFGFLLSCFWQVIVAFWDLIGVGDFIQSKLFFWLILIALSSCGIYFSAKHKKTLCAVISSLSDIALLFGAIFSLKKIKVRR